MTAVAIAATPVRPGATWFPPVLVALVALVVARWAAVPYVVGVFHDDGIYALLAQSIASGQGFHHSHLVGNPAATHYPPLYPLALSAVWRIAPAFPANVPMLLGFNAMLLAAAAWGWWRLATTRLAWAPGMAAAGALAATLTSPMLVLSSALLSEPLFLAMLWPTLALTERAAEPSRRRTVVIAGLCGGVLMLVRTHALALLIAFALVLVARRRWRDALIAFGTCVAVQLPWILWSRWATPRVPAPLEGAYGSYLGWFVDGLREGGASFLIGTAGRNLAECWLLLHDRFDAGLGSTMQTLVMALVVVALIAGAWATAKRAPVVVTFLALYMAVVLVWPYAPWRFVWAVWPLFAMLVLEGVRMSWTLSGRPARIGVAIGAVLLGAVYLRTELHAYATRSWRTPARQAAAQIAPALDWTRRRTSTDDVVLSDGEQVIALYVGRRAAPPVDFTAREYLDPPRSVEGSAKLAAMLAAVPARYVIILAPSLVASAASLATQRPGLRRIERIAGGAVYEVLR